MSINNKIFRVTSKGGGQVIASLGRKLGNKFSAYDKEMERRMKTATNLIWRTAHARRPLMTQAQAKAHGARVSLPDPLYTARGYMAGRNIAITPQNFSIAGVPVKTGRLQVSVIQKVLRKSGIMSFEGTIMAGMGVPYAGYIEVGTSKMAARPFMRPAIALNQEAIKRTFGARISSNL